MPEKNGIEKELKQKVEQIFEETWRKMGITNLTLQVDVATDVGGPPIVDENVYAEAFPFENPPRIWIQVWPDATGKEISKTVYHELLHVKHPELDEEIVEKKALAHVRLRGVRAR
jgi:aldehyde:ferredoxin oxidoreductase